MPVFSNSNNSEGLGFCSVSLERPAFDILAALIVHARLCSINAAGVHNARRQHVIVVLAGHLRMTEAVVNLLSCGIITANPVFRIKGIHIIG